MPKVEQVTPRQKRFVEQYLKCFNGAQAYREAYGKTANSDVHARRLMTIPHVQQAIETSKEWLSKTSQLEVTDFWQRMKEQHELDPAVFYNTDGTMKPLHEIPLEARKYLTRVEKTRNPKTGAIIKEKVGWIDPQVTTKQMGDAFRVTQDENKGLTAVQINIRYDEPSQSELVKNGQMANIEQIEPISAPQIAPQPPILPTAIAEQPPETDNSMQSSINSHTEVPENTGLDKPTNAE